jgi:hypothetical protein
MPQSNCQVEIDGDLITVTLAGTNYRALFRLSPDEPRLIQASQLSVDKAAPLSHQDFEAMAWEAANAKAKEVGWLEAGP